MESFLHWLEEQEESYLNVKWVTKASIKRSNILMKNLHWLIEKSFLVERKTETFLKPGMILVDEGGDEVVVMPDGRLYLGKGNWAFNKNYYKLDNTEITPKTLEKLNNISPRYFSIKK